MQTQLTHPQVHIGQVIRNAIVFNFKNWQKESMNVDALLQTVADLFALLKVLARILGKASKQMLALCFVGYSLGKSRITHVAIKANVVI